MLAKIHCLAIKRDFVFMPAAGLPSLQLCDSAVCFFFHGRSPPISFAHIYGFFFFQPLASPEGIQALSGATSPYAGRLNQNRSDSGFEFNGARRTLVFDYHGSGGFVSSHYRVLIGRLHLSVNWQPAQLRRWFSAPDGGVPGADVASRGPQLRHVCP